jgi:hypothetical protein
MKLEFCRQVSEKKAQISSFIKIRPVNARLFHADGQTDMTQLTVASRNFTNASNKKREYLFSAVACIAADLCLQ